MAQRQPTRVSLQIWRLSVPKARRPARLGLDLSLRPRYQSVEDCCLVQGSEGSKLPRIFVDGEEVSFDFAVASFLTEEPKWTRRCAVVVLVLL